MQNKVGKVRGSFRFSITQNANQIPSIQESFFYIVLLENDWNTPSTLALKNNKEKFINELGGHMLIEPTTETQKKELRKLFHSEEELEPLLIICQSYPIKWSKSLNANEGLKISLGPLDEQSVIKVLKFIAEEINKEEFLKKLKWKDRIISMQNIIKEITELPIIDLIKIML